MARARNGEAIGPKGRSPSARKRLRRLLRTALKRNDLDVWRRARAVLGYIEGSSVVDLATELEVTRGSVNRWLRWYETLGVSGLLTERPPGPMPKLDAEQRQELTALIEAGPQAAGYSSGVWTGPMIGDLIAGRFGVQYHNHHVPRLLHALGFSVQRPRRRLARVDTFGMRKTAHVFGAISLEARPRFHYDFAPVFNGRTFLEFLKHLVRRSRRKVFLVIDNGPCHNLDEEGKAWLVANRHRIALFRLPPYSPELNPIEGVWKQTKKRTSHNTFYRTTDERDAALRSTFNDFRKLPSTIARQVARFL